MQTRYIILSAAAAVLMMGCTKTADNSNAKYTDAILQNVYGDVTAIATYDYVVAENGDMGQCVGYDRCAYKAGIVTSDGMYSFYEEPDEYMMEMMGEYHVPVVDRDAQGRIVRLYTIEDDDTVSYKFSYDKAGRVIRREYQSPQSDIYSSYSYTYDNKGLMASCVEHIEYEETTHHDSILYTIDRVDEAGNWLERSSKHYETETEVTGARQTSTVQRTFEQKSVRVIYYAAEAQKYGGMFSYEEDDSVSDSIKAVFQKGNAYTKCDISYTLPANSSFYSTADIKQVVDRYVIHESDAKGNTLAERATVWGKKVDAMPAIDEVRWVEDNDYISEQVICRNAWVMSVNSRLLSINVTGYGSYSLTGDVPFYGDKYYYYDMQKQKEVRLRDLFVSGESDFLEYLRNVTDIEDLSMVDLDGVNWTIMWPMLSINSEDIYADAYIPEHYKDLSKYGKELIWDLNAADEPPFFD